MYFSYNGNRIFFKAEGCGDKTLLCLHGFPTSSHDYHKIWDALAAGFRVVSYDLIGYGSSDKPGHLDYTTFLQADVLEALLRQQDISEVDILAHDFGNTITQELLAREAEGRLPFKLKSICLLNGALFPETHRPVLAQKILISPLGFLFGRLITDSRFRASLDSIFGAKTKPTKEEMDDFVAAFSFNGGRKIAHKLIRYMAERAKHRERWVPPLRDTKLPVRFINGLADPVSGAHLVKRFREVMPHQDIIELPDIGHFPHFEVPERVTDLIAEFHRTV
jgi:pimeloyl-ACP methyl ester carboxylesterase